MKKAGLYILLLIVFVSCQRNRFDIDVSDVEIEEVKINRLEQDVFSMDLKHIDTETERLIEKYGDFYKAYIAGVINNGNVADSAYAYRMKSFITDRDMREAYDSCQAIYPDVNFLEGQFTGIFKRMKYYFPEKSTPKVVTMMSGFNYPVVCFDTTIAIGLDMYLGGNNKFYLMLAMPQYKSKFMHRGTIAPDAVRDWAIGEFPYNMNKGDFLSEIIYVGKTIFLTDVLIDGLHDSLKIQYTQKQLEYCYQNEFNVWSYFVAQKLLYTTNQADIKKFTSEGPFTAVFSKEAPPRIAYWIGWQIVRQFMENNPDVTLQELMELNDAQQLLAKSKYKPKQ